MTPIRSRTRIAATLTAAIRILRAVPHARNKTEAEAEQRKIQSQIDGGFYCSTPALFSEFVDNEYLPWAEANKKSHADDRRRAKVLKNFFGNERLRNIAPYRIEKFNTFATRLREQGVHPFDIKELMGHKTLSVTANYAHGTPEAMRGVVNRLRGTPARVVEFRAAG